MEADNERDCLGQITALIRDFVDERDWGKFHSPKNLAVSLSIEASELLEIFQWDASEQDEIPEPKFARIREEMADVFYYLLRLGDVTGIDLLAALKDKMEINARKYPAALVRGQSKKYDEY